MHEATATATWSRLLAGNHRFRDGKVVHPWQDSETRQSLRGLFEFQKDPDIPQNYSLSL